MSPTRVRNAKIFVSFQDVVHDGGVLCHGGVICIHRGQLEDGGPCGARIQGFAACDCHPPPPVPRWGSPEPTSPRAPGQKGCFMS